ANQQAIAAAADQRVRTAAADQDVAGAAGQIVGARGSADDVLNACDRASRSAVDVGGRAGGQVHRHRAGLGERRVVEPIALTGWSAATADAQNFAAGAAELEGV